MNKTDIKISKGVFSNFSEEITAVLKSNLAPKNMCDKLCAYHEKDIASVLALLTRAELHRLFCILSSGKLAKVLEYCEDATGYFEMLTVKQKADVLSHMQTVFSAELLQNLPKDERTLLLELLSPDICNEIGIISSFGEDEIGSRMSANFIEIPVGSTVKEAMSLLIKQAAEKDNISTLYLVDENKTFCGAVALNDLIIARESTPLSSVTTTSYPYLYAKAPVEACIPFLHCYAEVSIPVLDDKNRLLGVVRAQDFAEILGDELSDDYAKLAGLSSEEDLAEPIRLSVKKRLPWLCVLLVLGLGVSAVIGLFESVVAQLPIIICFQSLILDMAGNVGTQSLAVAIRVLMDSGIEHRQKVRLIKKELRIGLLNGGILGVLSFAAIGIYLLAIGNTPFFSFAISACLGFAMIPAMAASSLSGTLIPILFQKIGIDPAVASGPLITTINDLAAVVIYYGLSWSILFNVFHLNG